MSQLPYTTKALFEYKSDYEDDLSFSAGQLIKVTAIEDDEWLTGEYVDANGLSKSGMFPKNFVGPSITEEPEFKEEIPHLNKPTANAISSAEPASTIDPKPVENEEEDEDEEADEVLDFKTGEADLASSPIEQIGTGLVASPEKFTKRPSVSEGFSSKISNFDSGAPIPTPLTSNPFAKSQKSDTKPYQGHSSYIPPSVNKASTTVKKELSHSSYVPPLLGKREPSFSAASAAAPPPPVEISNTNDHIVEEEEGPKLSLKERIALLQKQQAEEAERQAALAAKKKQQKEAKEAAAAAAATTSTAHPAEQATETQQPSEDADEATESVEPVDDYADAEEEIVEHESVPVPGSHIEKLEPVEVVNHEEEQDQEHEGEDDDENDDDEDEDEEEDEEEAKRNALRHRMAKLAGAGGMYGAPGGFNPFGMPTGGTPTKKSTKKSKAKEEEPEANIPVAVPILPFAGGSAPQIPEVLRRHSSVAEEAGPKHEEIDTEIVDSDDLETVPESSAIEQEGLVEAVPEEDLPLTKKLENLDLSGPPRPNPSESAVEGDDEQEDDEKSPEIDQFAFTEQERQKEIENLSLDPHKQVETITPSQGVLSDYTTGYESDDDSQFPEPSAPPPVPSSNPDVTPVKRAPPPPPSVPPTAAPPILGARPPVPTPQEHKSVPPVPSSSIPPPVPHFAPNPPHQPVHRAPPPPPVPSHDHAPPQLPSAPSVPKVPTAFPPLPQGKFDDDDNDARSINSSLVSPVHDFNAPPLPQGQIPSDEQPFTPSKQLKSSHTGQSFTHSVLKSSHTGQSIPPLVSQSSGSGLKKASTFTHGSPSGNFLQNSDTEQAEKFDFESKWWLKNELPSFLQANVNKDLIFEVDEDTITRRDGTIITAKDFYILHQDNSQTILNVIYNSSNDSKPLSFETSTKPTPPFSQDHLDRHSQKFSHQILKTASSLLDQTISEQIVPLVYSELPSHVLPNVGVRSYGVTIYSNTNNTEIIQHTSFKPGDIIAINKAKFQGHNKLRQKVNYDVGNSKEGPFAAVITEFDQEKKKFRVLETDSKGKVKITSYKPSDMKSGKIKVFRVVDRGYVGW